jgi:hypothetical protein
MYTPPLTQDQTPVSRFRAKSLILLVPQEGFEPPTPALRSHSSRRLGNPHRYPEVYFSARECTTRSAEVALANLYWGVLQINPANSR